MMTQKIWTPSAQIDAFVDQISFNAHALLPAIAQQYDTGEVLMLAWMNREALYETLRTGFVCYWSRSRQRLWRKGESSGHWQQLIGLHLDCDGDTLLLRINQTGVACHTGARSCFFVDFGKFESAGSVETDPKS